MRLLISIVFLFCIITKSNSQNLNIMVIPNQTSVILNYQKSHSIGFYCGLYYIIPPYRIKSVSPLNFVNRVGLTYSTNALAVSSGMFNNFYENRFSPHLDCWFSIYPLRIIRKKTGGDDIMIGLSYSSAFPTRINYSVGASLSL